MSLICCIFALKFFGRSYWLTVVGALGLFYRGNTRDRTRFIISWLALEHLQTGPFDPALFGTYSIHLCVHRPEIAKPFLVLLVVYVGISWLARLSAKGYFSTGTQWGDR